MKTALSINQPFKDWVNHLKQDIRSAQIKAAVRVNSELLHLYWQLGAEIIERQKEMTWGSGFLEELSRELMAEFPDMKGFSYRNIRSIKQWYLFYNEPYTIWQQVVSKLGEEKFFSIPWGHHLYIISQGKAVNNFSRLLPKPQSDLALQTLKDPYNFDFLTITKDFQELELEKVLTQNITRFLLELGKGFAFVGRQMPLEVGDETIYPDLLFYHLELRCYCVIELKVQKFKPEFIGQLGTYISAVNHLKCKPGDNPTIGLLICKTKNQVMAQYALESTNQPIGISEYELSKLIPEDIKSQLPSIEEIEEQVKRIQGKKEEER